MPLHLRWLKRCPIGSVMHDYQRRQAGSIPWWRQEHRDNQAQSCRLPAVSADVARSGEKVCRTFPQPLDELLDALTEQIPGQPNGEARLLAAGVMATMVGSDSRG